MLLGATMVLIGGGLIKHTNSYLELPVPYTVALLSYGCLLGAWILYSESYTLQPKTKAGSYAWTDNSDPSDCVWTLPVDLPDCYIPNDLTYHGWHLGNALR